jgi:hypothetical protein
MLINEPVYVQYEKAYIMSELAIIAAYAKSSFSEISKQADALANGLLNAAPGGKPGTMPNKSIQYLLDTSEKLAKSGEECEQFLKSSSLETKS